MIDLGERYYKLEDLENEVWKPLTEWYEISNFGRVKTKPHYVPCLKGCFRLITERILRPAVGTNGYLQVGIGKGVRFFIHRAVAELFCEKKDLFHEVDHINSNKLDNRAENLRWISHYENSRRANLGRHKDNSMENNPRAKIVVGIKDGTIVERYDCAKKISFKYGINYSTLRKGLQHDNMFINGVNYYYQDRIKTCL